MDSERFDPGFWAVRLLGKDACGGRLCSPWAGFYRDDKFWKAKWPSRDVQFLVLAVEVSCPETTEPYRRNLPSPFDPATVPDVSFVLIDEWLNPILEWLGAPGTKDECEFCFGTGLIGGLHAPCDHKKGRYQR